MTAAIMAGFGYLVILVLTLWVGKLAFGAISCSLAFTGKLTGEVWFLVAILAFLIFLCWFLFPFQVAISVAPVGVR